MTEGQMLDVQVFEGEPVDDLPVEHYIDEGPNYVSFKDGTPFEVWYAYMRHLGRTGKGYMFWLGDSVIFGEKKYRQYEQALSATDYDYGTLRNAKWVCERVEVSRRRDTLYFAHHQEVAPLEPAEQDKWLDAAEPVQGAERARLSQRALRDAIKEEAKQRRIEAAEAAEEEEQGELELEEGESSEGGETEEKPKPKPKPKKPQLPKVEVAAGEWWKLGEHILFCGDSSGQEFRDALPDAALAFADPPYNAGAAHWDFGFLWEHDYLADVADVVAVTPGIASIFDFTKVTRMPYKWSLAGFISNGMTRGAVGYGNWIYAAMFSRRGVYRQAQDAIRFSIKIGETSDTNHKGRKPAELMAYIVDTFSKKGETVIDPFLGSGSTLYACHKLERQCIGAEIEPEYCTQIVARWQRLSGSPAERIAG